MDKIGPLWEIIMKPALMLIILTLVLAGVLDAKKLPPLTTVDKVDLNRYSGLWYQFAYFPNSFQPKDAKLTTAEYTKHSKGYIVVKNTSYKDREGTQVKSDITGKAFIADKKTNAKLKVQFFWPFRADYWIILLDEENYRWAVVSNPSRKYLWILSREPEMTQELYDSLLAQIRAKDIDTGRLVVTGWFK
jgi:apolipoprotein D and lipocalin family protein